MENFYELGVRQQKLKSEYTHIGSNNTSPSFVRSDIQREQMTF